MLKQDLPMGHDSLCRIDIVSGFHEKLKRVRMAGLYRHQKRVIDSVHGKMMHQSGCKQMRVWRRGWV